MSQRTINFISKMAAAVKASRSLQMPGFQTGEGKAVEFQKPNVDAPIEVFSKVPPGGSTMIGAEETTYLICPKSTIQDAQNAGIDIDAPLGFKKFMDWRKKRIKRDVKMFKADIKDDQIVWVLEEDSGLQPNDFVCLPLEGITKK